MSANNWGICPKCKKLNKAWAVFARGLGLRHNHAINAKRFDDAAKKYGKIPAEEYIKLAGEAAEEHIKLASAAAIPIKLGPSLREDWDCGTTKNGEVYIRYSCSCEVCGLKYQFKHNEQLNLTLQF